MDQVDQPRRDAIDRLRALSPAIVVLIGVAVITGLMLSQGTPPPTIDCGRQPTHARCLLPSRASSSPATRHEGEIVVGAAGDIACGEATGPYAACRYGETATLLDPVDLVLPLGDLQYECGGAKDFGAYYEPTWGRYKAKTRPVPGNHEYPSAADLAAVCPGDSADARDYFAYFGAADETGAGYYSFDLGSWHLVALNSNCGAIGGCGVGSPQEEWLRRDLAAHPTSCLLAYLHHPLFATGDPTSAVQPLWQALYEAGADIVLAAHLHHYERFAPQRPDGTADPQGIRSFIVGTGGKDLEPLTGAIAENSEVRDDTTFGILQLTLRAESYKWVFVPVPSSVSPFRDAGSGSCTGTTTPDRVAPREASALGRLDTTARTAHRTRSVLITTNTGRRGFPGLALPSVHTRDPLPRSVSVVRSLSRRQRRQSPGRRWPGVQAASMHDRASLVRHPPGGHQ